METVLLLARVLLALILALIFLVAGMAKLADRGGSKQAVIDFGLPTRLAPHAPRTTPWSFGIANRAGCGYCFGIRLYNVVGRSSGASAAACVHRRDRN